MTTSNTTTTAATTEIAIGIGQMAVASDPGAVLVTHGLGSCVGVSAFDPKAGVGGLLHLMLPARGPGTPAEENPCRFADSGVDALLEALLKRDVALSRLQLKAAGGACIVAVPGFGDRFRIGERNVEALRESLHRHGLQLAAEDVGGAIGRTMRLRIADGVVTVHGVGKPAVEL